jgi:hypothetical protein
MSSISAINNSLNKFFIPIDVQRIIYQYLTIEDYDKARAKFNKNFLNRMSLNHPSLTLFNGVLGDTINIKEQFLKKFPIMRYIYRKSDNYLNKETNFYNLYENDDITRCGMDFYDLENGYIPIDSIIEFYNENDASSVGTTDEKWGIKPVEGYDNIEILAETYRAFRCKYSMIDYDYFIYFKYDGVVYKKKILY